jgi:hypothetical protein
LQDEYKDSSNGDVMYWFFWDAAIFVKTLQDDTKDSSNGDVMCWHRSEQKLRDFAPTTLGV